MSDRSVRSAPACPPSRATRQPWLRAASVLGVLLLGPGSIASAATITIDNDLVINTLGHWSVDVEEGGYTDEGRVTAQQADDMVIVQAEEIIFEYTTYIDVGNNGTAVDLGDSATVAANLSGDDQVTSSGSFTGANGNTINWTAVSSIPAAGPTMTTVYTFTAVTGTLGVFRLHQYLDEDVDGSSDDVLFTRGAFATSDLELFTVDNTHVYGVSHGGAYTGGQGLSNATFAGWAADEYSDLRSAIQGAGAVVSPTGVIDVTALPPLVHPIVGPAFGPNDVTSVLSWDVDPAATTATIITTLGGVPQAPPPEQTATPTSQNGIATATATATRTSTPTSTPAGTATVPEVPTLSSGGAAALILLLAGASVAYLAVIRRRSG